MNVGIDFGTSNCSIGRWQNGKPSLIQIEEQSSLMPSALFTFREQVPVEEIEVAELKKRIANVKRNQTLELKKAEKEKRAHSSRLQTDEEIEVRQRGILRRESADRSREKFRTQEVGVALYPEKDFLFGESAIREHIMKPAEGFFIKSPKSFLGAKLKQHQIYLFTEIITRMFAHIKSVSERIENKEISKAVVGRPVNFHFADGDEGNLQAIGILETAAIAAGFNEIEFLIEPIAAALDFERTLSEDVNVLVLDAGGGTTDCSMVRIGPSFRENTSRNQSVLGTSGVRVGGVDMDINLNLQKVMPLLGMNTMLTDGIKMPNSFYWNAAKINDVNLQEEFLSRRTGFDIESFMQRSDETEKLNRLLKLHSGKHCYRLSRSSELAKIHLSDRESINLPLKYLEQDFVIQVSRDDLEESVKKNLDTFVSLMREVEKQSNVTPDIVYVTGGTARSPIVEKFIRMQYPNIKIVIGDLFGSVTSGLTTWSHRIYD